MIRHQTIRLLLLVFCTGTWAFQPGRAQEVRFQVIDQVDLPGALKGEAGSNRYLEFRETWLFHPDKPSLLKEASEYILRDPQDSVITAVELLSDFGMQVGRQPVREGRVQIKNIRYEFNLLDPHMFGSGMEGFQVPDSMDRLTRELQEAFIALLKSRTLNAERYNWEEQMLSVEFLEHWSIDPATLTIIRVVESVTPVIWQRRQTEEGVPVDEAGTGNPVYYKNSLRPVSLRNP